jgi:hypothetical protein
MAVQEVRWDEAGTQPADSYTFFCGNGTANHHLVIGFSFIGNQISSYEGKICWCRWKDNIRKGIIGMEWM